MIHCERPHVLQLGRLRLQKGKHIAPDQASQDAHLTLVTGGFVWSTDTFFGIKVGIDSEDKAGEIPRKKV